MFRWVSFQVREKMRRHRSYRRLYATLRVRIYRCATYSRTHYAKKATRRNSGRVAELADSLISLMNIGRANGVGRMDTYTDAVSVTAGYATYVNHYE